MRDTSNKDKEYLEALQREVYYDVVRRLIKAQEVSPILGGARGYLQLRRRLWARMQQLKYWLQYKLKRGILMLAKAHY